VTRARSAGVTAVAGVLRGASFCFFLIIAIAVQPPTNVSLIFVGGGSPPATLARRPGVSSAI